MKGKNMQLYDINIIRTRWNDNDKWRYEICSEDDLDDYYCCESDYSYIGGELAKTKLEVIYSGDIHFTDDVLERILPQFSPEGE